jgi:integrase/recombinase XerD
MLDTLFETYCREKRLLEDKSELTIKSYRQAFNRYQKACGNELPTEESLKQYVMSMRETLKETSCNISIRAFNAFLTWLAEFDHTPARLRIKQIKEPKTTYRGYTDEEIKKVLRFKPQGFFEWRLITLACLLIDTGCRIEEVLTLKTGSLDLNNQLLRVKGKGGKERVIPFSFELRKLLFLYLRKRQDKTGDYVFCATSGNRLSYRNILRDWEGLCHKIDIPYRPFHSLRHNFALSFIREGGDVFTLKRLLGHSTLQTTQIYVDLQTEDLKRSHAKTSILSRLKS